MGNYLELINTFNEVDKKLDNLIQKFPSERREEVVFDKWSLKNVVSHLNHWMVHDLDCLNALRDNKVPYWEPDIEEFNRKGVEARSNNNWEQVYSEFVELKNKLLNLYKEIPEDLRNKKIWPNKNETPEKFLKEDIKHWRDEHIFGLNKFFDDNNKKVWDELSKYGKKIAKKVNLKKDDDLIGL